MILHQQAAFTGTACSVSRFLGKAISQRTILRLSILLVCVYWRLLALLGVLVVWLANVINLALALVGGGWPFALVGHF